MRNQPVSMAMRLWKALIELVRILRALAGCYMCAFTAKNILWQSSAAADVAFYLPLVLICWAALSRPPHLIGGYAMVRYFVYASTILVLCISPFYARGVDFAVIGLVMIFCLPRKADEKLLANYRKGLWLAAGVVIPLSFWSIGNIALVAWRAKVLAQENAYCIDVIDNGSGGDRYRSVDSLLDLRGLAMRAPPDKDGLYWGFHAVLVLRQSGKDRLYNWSYRNSRFMEVAPQDIEWHTPSELSCKPQPHFLWRVLLGPGKY